MVSFTSDTEAVTFSYVKRASCDNVISVDNIFSVSSQFRTFSRRLSYIICRLYVYVAQFDNYLNKICFHNRYFDWLEIRSNIISFFSIFFQLTFFFVNNSINNSTVCNEKKNIPKYSQGVNMIRIFRNHLFLSKNSFKLMAMI